jgi:putative peptidoglycan lipid II flippase
VAALDDAVPSVGRSTLAMATGTAASRVAGMIRAAVLGAAIGVGTTAANAFDAANTVPNFFYAILAEGVLNAVLVPQIVRAFSRGQGEEFVHRLLTLATVLLGALTALLTVAAGFWLILFTQDWDAEKLRLGTLFAYWCLPQVFFYGIYLLWSQVLNARNVFGVVMWAPVANNVVSIVGFGVFIAAFGRYRAGSAGAGVAGAADAAAGQASVAWWGSGQVALLAGTATLGIALQALILIVPMARVGLRPRWRWGFRGFGLGRAARMTGWTALSLVFSQGAMWVAIRLASAAEEAASGQTVASNAIFTLALSIYIIPHSLITVSLTTALFTRMSEHAQAGELGMVRQDLSYAIMTTSAFSFLFTALLVVLALPLGRVLQPGISLPEVEALVGPVVAMSLGLVPLGMTLLVKRVFFALEEGRTLLALQIPMSLLFAGFSLVSFWLLPPAWWVTGIGLGQTLSFLAGAILRLTALRDRLDGIGGRELGWMHLRAGLAACLSAEAGWLVLRLFPGSGAAGVPTALSALVVVGLLMTLVYVGLLKLLGVTQLADFVRPFLNRSRTG